MMSSFFLNTNVKRFTRQEAQVDAYRMTKVPNYPGWLSRDLIPELRAIPRLQLSNIGNRAGHDRCPNTAFLSFFILLITAFETESVLIKTFVGVDVN